MRGARGFEIHVLDSGFGQLLAQLHLHFAETGLADFISAESSGEGQRVFRVSANGKLILDFFDVVADAAGANTSDERVFRNISPASDGFLHLGFAPVRGTAMLNGIEVLPVSAGKVRPIRIRAGWTSAWRDSSGEQWQADSYFMGGNALVRTMNPAQASNSIVPDMALYASERWGHFSYALPVAEGRYRMTLRFCEGHYGKKNGGRGGVGSRLFDIYCNGVAQSIAVLRASGPMHRARSVQFVPVNGMAFVNGIEVVEDVAALFLRALLGQQDPAQFAVGIVDHAAVVVEHHCLAAGRIAWRPG